MLTKQNLSLRMHFRHAVLFSATQMVGVLKFLDINIICYSILDCEAMKPASVPQEWLGWQVSEQQRYLK
jgi:hypothetical protein